MRHVTSDDVSRARLVLIELAARQDALGAELDVSGIQSFAERAEWLASRRSADEQRAWDHRWRHLPKPRGPRVKTPKKPDTKLTSLEMLNELDWLIQNGANAWEAAEALKRDPKTISRMAYRHGRPDIATFIDTARAA